MMNNTTYTPKVSVIIPAYNAEKYIRRCLVSIAEQTLPDIEVIVVNDGSTDGTGKIADEFARSDPRFHVIHQENKGVAAARQAALNYASGVYSIHVDSDDWINPEMLEHLVSRALEEDDDMVICDFIVHGKDGQIEVWRQDPESSDHWVVLGKTFHDLHGSLCNKLIRKSCYIMAGARFDESMYACEDLWVTLSLMTLPIRIAYLGEALYHYDQSQNAASYVNANPLIKERLSVLDKFATKYGLCHVEKYYDNAIVHLAYDALFFSQEHVPDYKSMFAKHRKSILRASGFPFHVLFLIILGTFGIRIPIGRIKRVINA